MLKDMLPFIQAPAISHCHAFSVGTRTDVTGGVHGVSFPLTVDVNIVCRVFSVQTGLFHSHPGLLMLSCVSLCRGVSQHSSQVKAVAPSTLSVPPKRCPPALSKHADLETKHLRGWGLNRPMGPVLPEAFIDLHL